MSHTRRGRTHNPQSAVPTTKEKIDEKFGIESFDPLDESVAD